MIATLTGFEGAPIQGIKTLRLVTGGGLRYSKMEVYDRVIAGHPVDINIDTDDAPLAVEELRRTGWVVDITNESFVALNAQIPREHAEMIMTIIKAFGGTNL